MVCRGRNAVDELNAECGVWLERAGLPATYAPKTTLSRSGRASTPHAAGASPMAARLLSEARARCCRLLPAAAAAGPRTTRNTSSSALLLGPSTVTLGAAAASLCAASGGGERRCADADLGRLGLRLPLASSSAVVAAPVTAISGAVAKDSTRAGLSPSLLLRLSSAAAVSPEAPLA